jgi:hypothetical protein
MFKNPRQDLFRSRKPDKHQRYGTQVARAARSNFEQQYARNFSSDRTICGESCPLCSAGGALVNPCRDKMAQITWLSEVAVRLKQRAVCTIKWCSLLAVYARNVGRETEENPANDELPLKRRCK